MQREGCQRLGHDPLRQSVGPDDLQVRSLRHRRAHFRSAGVHARRHQADRLPGERRRGGKPQRPDLRGRNGQLRQVVRVLPDARAGQSGGRWHRVFGTGPDLPRRLPHALGEQHAVHEHRGFHDGQQADMVHQALRGRTEQWHAVAGRCLAHWRTVFGEYRGDRTAGRHGSAQSDNGKMPTELPPVVDRRLLEFRAVVREPRRRRQDRAFAVQSARSERVLPRHPSFRDRTYEGPTASSNSLADLAMYYWIHDLRPTVPDQ